MKSFILTTLLLFGTLGLFAATESTAQATPLGPFLSQSYYNPGYYNQGYYNQGWYPGYYLNQGWTNQWYPGYYLNNASQGWANQGYPSYYNRSYYYGPNSGRLYYDASLGTWLRYD